MTGLPQGFDEFAVDLDGDGALEHLDAEHETPLIPHPDEGAFKAGEGTTFDTDAVSGMEVGVWVRGQIAGDQAANSLDFVGRDGSGFAAKADDVGHARGLENGEEGVGVEAGEEVTAEKRQFDDLDAIGPLAAGAVDGEEGFNATRGQRPGGERLVTGFSFYGKPHPAGTSDWHERAGFAPFSPMA